MIKPIKDLLPTIFNQKHCWKFDLLRNWDSIFGNLNSKVHLEKMYDDTLILGVYDACWMQELYLLSPLLIKTINEKLDQPRIKQIRFKRTGIRKSNLKKRALKKVITPKPVRLNLRERKALERIEDPQLSSVLKKFLIRCYQEKR